MITEENKKNRMNGIGASESSLLYPEIPNSYMTRYELYLIKTGQLSNEGFNDYQWWGNELEPVISKRYEIETGEKLEIREETFVHPRLHFMICHPDRFVIGKNKLVEIKTASFMDNKWGDNKFPQQYYIQVQHQMAVTGAEEVDLIVLFMGNRKTNIYTISRNEDAIKELEEKVSDFWCNNIEKRVAPEMACLKDYKNYCVQKDSRYIEADREAIRKIKDIQFYNEQIKDIEREKEKASLKILSSIKEGVGMRNGDKIIATWKTNKNGVRSLRLSEV